MHRAAAPDVLDHADWRALGTGVRLVVLDGDLGRPGRVDRVLDGSTAPTAASGPTASSAGSTPARAQTVARQPAPRPGDRGRPSMPPSDRRRVDPTVGRAMRAHRLRRRLRPIRGPGAASSSASSRPRLAGVALRRAAARSGCAGGVELDLGSTGKALAADLAAAAALAAATGAGRGGVLVSLGGDIATAGRRARRRLADPRRRGQRDAGRRRRRGDRDPGRGDRHVEHDRSPLAARRPGRSTT